MVKLKIGDLVKVQDCHHAEPHVYEVAEICLGGFVSQPAAFFHRTNEIVAVYRFNGNDYKEVWSDKKDHRHTAADAAPPTVWYVCDRNKCVPCNNDCKYTSDITHAANFTVLDTAGANGTPFGFVEKLHGGRRK